MVEDVFSAKTSFSGSVNLVHALLFTSGAYLSVLVALSYHAANLLGGACGALVWKFKY